MKKLIIAFLSVIGLSCQATAQWAHFSAPANRIAIGDIAVTGNAITIEALVNIQDYSPTQPVNDIVSKHHGPPDLSYLFRPNDFAIQTTNGIHSASHNYTLCFDSTYHLAGTYDGDSIRFFINGSKVAAEAWTGDLFQNTFTTSIGMESPGANYQEQFIGYISELRIWNTARTASQLQANMYDLSNPASQAGLLAYYKFGNGYQNLQGNTAYDGVPDGNAVAHTTNPHFSGSVNHSFCYPTAINEQAAIEHEFSIYPNPASFAVHISNKAHTAVHNVLTLTNSTGTLLLKEELHQDNHTVHLDGYPAGIYFLTLITDKGILSKKIIKE